MANEPQSMKAVMATLRQQGAPAFLEVLELHVTMGELELRARGLSAALREIAGETAALAETHELASHTRLRALAGYARTASSTADVQAAALGELTRGLDAWNLA